MDEALHQEITKACLALVIPTFEQHGYFPDGADLRVVHGDEGDSVILILLAVSLSPVSGIGKPVDCAGTVRINRMDGSIRLHLLSAEFSGLN
jgi:hypothetical protein